MNVFPGFQQFEELFLSLGNLFKPKLVVELGGGYGYILDLFSRCNPERMVCVGFPFNDLNPMVELRKGDALDPNANTDLSNIDVLIVDIDNHFSKVVKALDLWLPRTRGIVIIEGGHSVWSHGLEGEGGGRRENHRLVTEYFPSIGWESISFPFYPGFILARNGKTSDEY